MICFKRIVSLIAVLAIIPTFAFASPKYITKEFTLLSGLRYFAVQIAEAEELTLQDQAKMWADSFSVSFKQLDGTFRCESNYNQNARGKAGEIGIAQYMPRTFAMFEKEYGKDLNIYDAGDQIELTAWAFSKKYQRHWTCARILGYVK